MIVSAAPTDCSNPLEDETSGTTYDHTITPTKAGRGVDHSYRVCSVGTNDQVSSGATTTITVTNISNITNLIAVYHDPTTIRLSWIPPRQRGFKAVKVAYMPGATVPTDCSSPLENETSGTTYDHTITAPEIGMSTEHSYRVCSVGADDQISEGKTVRMTVETPDEIARLMAIRHNSTTIRLSWVSQKGDFAGFKVAYAAGGTAPANCDTPLRDVDDDDTNGNVVFYDHTVAPPAVGTSASHSYRVCPVAKSGTTVRTTGATTTLTIPSALSAHDLVTASSVKWQ